MKRAFVLIALGDVRPEIHRRWGIAPHRARAIVKNMSIDDTGKWKDVTVVVVDRNEPSEVRWACKVQSDFKEKSHEEPQGTDRSG